MMDIPTPPPMTMPTVRESITIGPDEYIRGRIISFAKDRETGFYFRFGHREAVLLRGLKEGISFDSLATTYLEAFGRRLSEASLLKAVEVFSRTGLIEGDGTPVSRAQDGDVISGASPTLFSFKMFRWDPDEYLSGILPLWRWLGSPVTFVVGALVILFVEMGVSANFSAIFKDAGTMAHHNAVVRLIALIAVNSVMLTLHEGAHALVCKAYGGEVREMGFQIRYLTFTPYTRLDDVLLLRSRWRRAGVFIAGPFASLMALPVALGFWLVTGQGTLAHEAAADVLVWYNLLCLLQFVPFMQLDGYFVLAQALKMPELRQDSFSYLYRGILSAVGMKDRVHLSPDIARYVRPVYLAYGVLSFVTTTGILILFIVKNARWLSTWLGSTAGYSIPTLVIGLLLVRFVFQLRAYNGYSTWRQS